MSDDKIKELPVRFKERPSEGVYLTLSRTIGKCYHGQYEVDDAKAEVVCTKCKEKIDPMVVLREMAHKETGWHRARIIYQEEMKRLEERARTKCQHCGKLTRISRS